LKTVKYQQDAGGDSGHFHRYFILLSRVGVRTPPGWRVLASVQVPAQKGPANFLPASSAASGLDALLDKLMLSPALDLEVEAELIRQGWE
jgi:hypothetical protein